MIGTGLPKAICPSPNFNERRGDAPVSILVLHYTGMNDAASACAWLCNPASQVSCHYLIDEDGHITQMVDESMRAWHAGVSAWRGQVDINSVSVGIEIQNCGHGADYAEYPIVQMQAVAALSLDIVTRHKILPRHVLGHSDVAPGRKVDPGEKFDWEYLHGKGVGHFVEAELLRGGSFLQEGDEGDSVMAWQSFLKLYGYELEINWCFDARTRIVTEAFQRHFRQSRVDGIADQSTVATLHKLLRAV